MVLPLLAGLAMLVLLALVVSLAMCVAAARADRVMHAGAREGDEARADALLASGHAGHAGSVLHS